MTKVVALVVTLPFAGVVALGAVQYGKMFTTVPRERCRAIERERFDFDDDEVLGAEREAWPPSLTCTYREIDNGRVWRRQQPEDPVASLVFLAGSAGFVTLMSRVVLAKKPERAAP